MTTGVRLGPYEILAAIGAGGMGEVYKARDLRLDRTVAVKVLPEHIARQADLRARFEREARAVASLSHPNICTLHDIGLQDGTGYMVMELIDGETLSARLKRGPMPLEQVLLYARQIADAMDRAHRAGVMHRDIKPQNIMLTRDGAKVLDFGLAKTGSNVGPSEAALAEGLTSAGMVMGTPQYMAPEQFEGREADARSDIWAFGAVLYEMAAGRKAFEGASYVSLVSAIMTKDPAPLTLAETQEPISPKWLERLVRRCLNKDPEKRYQCMRDVVLDLENPPVEEAAAVARVPKLFYGLIGVAVLLLGVLGGIGLMWYLRGSKTEEMVQRFELAPPKGGQFQLGNGFALSPDGKAFAFVGTGEGKSGIWVRSMEGGEAKLLPETEGAASPFWAPDGHAIAFWTSGKIRRVDVGGGAPTVICDSIDFRGGDWGEDGTIVFAAGPAGLRQVSAAGGEPSTLLRPETVRGEVAYRWPQFLAGGKVLFQVVGKTEVAGIYLTSVAKPEQKTRLVASTAGNALYAAGHLLWLRGTSLVAQPFDVAAGTLQGEARAVAEPVGMGAFGRVVASVSTRGLLVHGESAEAQLAWVDRSGQPQKTFGQPGEYASLRLSPDGERVVVGRASLGGRDLWMVDLERDAWSRFTFLPGFAQSPVWSASGKHLLFSAGAPSSLYQKEASGAGTEHHLTQPKVNQMAADWSKDGKLLLYQEDAGDTKRDLWVVAVTAEGMLESGAKPRAYLQSGANEYQGRFSPEPSPKWVAYTSDESGREEVYVQTFPEPKGKFQISLNGGRYPEWSADGKELYFLSAEGKLMAVEMKTSGDSFAPSTPKELFALMGEVGFQPYEVGKDGNRFLVLEPPGGRKALSVVLNWPVVLKKTVAK